MDRAFWVALFRLWPRWKDARVIVSPDTVVRWHDNGFRRDYLYVGFAIDHGRRRILHFNVRTPPRRAG